MPSEQKTFLITTDFSVTKEKFELIHDPELELLKTVPVPGPEEIGSYYESSRYISHSDANVSFKDKLYQTVKKYTLSRKLSLLNSFYTAEKTVLDIGCGTGDFLVKCAQNSWKVVGVEPNKKARAIALKKLNQEAGAKMYSNLEELGTEQFYVITLWHVLEHVPNVELYINNIKKLLHPAGILIIAVPNYKSFDAAHYKEYWAGYDVPRHLWHFSKKSIQQIFARKKMELMQTLPMWFDAFYVSLLSEGYKKSRFQFLRAFLIGCWSNLNGLITKEHSSHIYVLKKAKADV